MKLIGRILNNQRSAFAIMFFVVCIMVGLFVKGKKDIDDTNSK